MIEPGVQLAELVPRIGPVADEAEHQPAIWLNEAHVPHLPVLGGEVVGLAKTEKPAVPLGTQELVSHREVDLNASRDGRQVGSVARRGDLLPGRGLLRHER